MCLVDQIIMAKLDPIFGQTQVDPNYDLKWVGSSRSEIWSCQVGWALKVGSYCAIHDVRFMNSLSIALWPISVMRPYKKGQ